MSTDYSTMTATSNTLDVTIWFFNNFIHHNIISGVLL